MRGDGSFIWLHGSYIRFGPSLKGGRGAGGLAARRGARDRDTTVHPGVASAPVAAYNPSPMSNVAPPPPAPPPFAPPPFLPVQELLESSLPQPRVAWLGWATALLLLVVFGSAILTSQAAHLRWPLQLLSAAAMIAALSLITTAGVAAVRRHQAAQRAVDAAAELVQLRRWPEAALLLQQILSRPARTANLRTQALIGLSAVLARYHRFADAIVVHEHVLEHGLVDEPTAHSLRLGRAMSMLREDHLFDADRAISELRRATRGGPDSPGLALVELYRDVKTGHPVEAAGLFESRLTALRDGLGHRVADAYVLAAKAYDMLSRPTEAQNAYTRATLLAPLMELQRRYPEVASLAERYAASPAPPEAA
jgi:tetratricopeptide (TPR) repeat protein